jgi:L-malate glycosyltransferase
VNVNPPARYFALGVTDRRGWPRAAFRLARYLRRHRIDVLHTHLVHAALVGTVAARLARTPYLVHMRHHIDDVRLTGGAVHVALDRALACAADEVVVPSQAAKRYLAAEEGIDPAHVTVVHLGFDVVSLNGDQGDAAALRSSLGIADGFVVGCVARLSPNKGHRFLFEAVARLRGEIPNIRLMLIGEGAPAPYVRMATEAGIADRTLFLGQRPDVPALMRAMDVVTLPSLSESFSQVIIEALAAARPLVSTDVGGALEVLADGDNALIVPPADAGALAAAIRRLHGDADLRGRLVARARPSIEPFSVPRMIAGHLEVYERAPVAR